MDCIGRFDLTLSSTEVAGIHASTLILCWVGIALTSISPCVSFAV
jgi:hypothetical protein